MSKRSNWRWWLAKRLFCVMRVPAIRRFVSREYTDTLASSTPPRPHGHSLWFPHPAAQGEDLGPITEYVSWRSLTDRSFSARHLPPIDDAFPVPPRPAPAPAPGLSSTWDDTTELWRRDGKLIPCERSSVLFAFFAQWFTDSILRVDLTDRRRNTSTHDIDLCQIYGLCEATTQLLRSREPTQKGELAHRTLATGDYPELLCEPDGAGKARVREAYRALPYTALLPKLNERFPEERLLSFYATGLERGNSSIGYVALSTLFLREHNRIARKLAENGWDGERVFQTARCINILVLLKLLVEEYINHIVGERLFLLEPGFAERRRWYRQNWIALEFNLLYRWHSLMPSELELGGKPFDQFEFRNNNALFEELGLGSVLAGTSLLPAGKIRLSNTPEFLLPAEYESLRMARSFRLASFNAYCRHFSVEPASSFDDLTADPKLAERLRKHYGGDIEKLEYLVGIFAEQADEDVLFGRLMARMVAYDALTQIYSSPLLSSRFYNKETLTQFGLDTIEDTTSLQALVDRNVEGCYEASLERKR